jgi:hypothetical protein
MTQRQKAAVRWFMGKSRTNFERLIVNAVLSRMRIRGIRTAVDNDEGGDANAYQIWKEARGKLWSREVHKHALSMRSGYVIVGENPKTGKLLVTAEDPRNCTALCDPADPISAEAGLKMVYNPWTAQDIAYLYLPGVVRKAVRQRQQQPGGLALPLTSFSPFNMQSFNWADDEPGDIEWLAETGDMEAIAPIVPFHNEDKMAEFEPHIEVLDRISHQVLQRMTVATIQAFRQRAMKGLPRVYPKGHELAGQEIDYEELFTADPGAIWNIPQAAEIWESGQADISGLVMAIRDDVKDMSAASGTPLYSISPDVAAQGSAEGASLQREGVNFKVESREEMWELNHERVCELMFRQQGKQDMAESGKIEIIWAPTERLSWGEIGSAVAQTKGTVPTYMQLTKIVGLNPDEADRAMKLLDEDAARQMKQAQAANATLRDAHAGGAEIVGQGVPAEAGAPTVPGKGAPPQKAQPALSGAPGAPVPPRPPASTGGA